MAHEAALDVGATLAALQESAAILEVLKATKRKPLRQGVNEMVLFFLKKKNIMQAQPVANEADRRAAEQTMMAFKRSEQPYTLCKHILGERLAL